MIKEITINIRNKEYVVDLSKGHDLSIAVDPSKGARAWYVDLPTIEPVKTDQFNGSVKDGGNVNFRNIFFNPHGNGTHTECLGHITEKVYSVNSVLSNYFFEALLITIDPEKKKEDLIITKELLEEKIGEFNPEALIIRTLPNTDSKLKRDYSESNPAYFTDEAMHYINSIGVEHLLIDLPSVDREKDEGVLSTHHIFWNVPEKPNFTKTITEFIYASEEINDGSFLLNLQLSPIENDAAPSRPVIYPIQEKK